MSQTISIGYSIGQHGQIFNILLAFPNLLCKKSLNVMLGGTFS
ncbi:hypothetical protein CKA32_005360 [Geitlerinema sp. FC II]|nr:hypothetical protein CKA32_005360 [Geitlerinema sp. FC II]